jgi:hypothetical protein
VRTRSTRLALASLIVFLLSSAPARAEWQFTPFIGYTFSGSTTLWDPFSAADDTQWNFGGAVTLLGEGPLGVEGYFVRTPSFFQGQEGLFAVPGGPTITESRSYAIAGNIVLATPRSWNRYGLRPFVSGGLGWMHASHDERLAARVNLLGMNVGGGAVGYLTNRVGLRFDLRYFRNVRGVPDDNRDLAPTTAGAPVRIRYWTTAIGVVIRY